MPEIDCKFARAAVLMQESLSQSTGLKDRDRKIIAYWTLATHALQHLDTFPLLALLGKMGTGKSQTLEVIGNFAFRSSRLSLRGMTGPTIRDKFAECLNGTAIIEEADQAWKDSEMAFERLLSDRYQRYSAQASLKAKLGEKNWDTVNKAYFGATALHRRLTFQDAALDGRTISVKFRPDHSKTYREFCSEDSWNVEGKELVRNVVVKLPQIESPTGIAARILNTYRPLLATAQLCGDEEFAEQMHARLQQDTLELKEAQSAEPDGLVLRAVVEAVYEPGSPKFRNLKFSVLSEAIWRNHRVSLTPRQIGLIARELGFVTKTSHGTTVVTPTPATLLKACDDCDYVDEAIADLREAFLRTDPNVI